MTGRRPPLRGETRSISPDSAAPAAGEPLEAPTLVPVQGMQCLDNFILMKVL